MLLPHRRILLRAPLAVLSLMLGAAPCVAQEAALLDRAREALGRPRGVVLAQGASKALGVEGRYTLAFDNAGRFRTQTKSPLGTTGGFDGTSAWETDWNAMPRVLELEDLDSTLLETWAITGYWAWASDVVGITETPDPEDHALALSMSGGKLLGTAELDPGTNLPTRITIHRPVGDAIIELGGFEKVAGLAMPREVMVTSPNGEQVHITVESAESGEPGPAIFAAGPERPQDTTFDAGIPPEIEVKRAPTGHLLVKPLVNGQDLGWFILDTGAGASVLSPDAAAKIGAERIGSIAASGVGGTVQTGFYRVDTIQIGQVTMKGQALIGLDLSFLKPYFGVDVGGLLGYDLLARCVADIDMSAAAVSLHDPATFTLPEGGVWQELMLAGRQAVVHAGFEGHDALFRLDTGAAGSSIMFHAPTVERLKLLEGRDTARRPRRRASAGRSRLGRGCSRASHSPGTNTRTSSRSSRPNARAPSPTPTPTAISAGSC
ncbi:MAG: clan AA aspartic protease [Phycisphaerales bacterium]|nr:clan AA aspartic protease [Phycisphaerales bacterium]